MAQDSQGALVFFMPVIELSLSRLTDRTRNKVTKEKILETLPYLGLDIEDRQGDAVIVEYSPNRPDFCSEAGIARSLLGLLGLETGLPRYEFAQSPIRISVEGREIQSVRPFIFSLYAALNVSEEVIKQLIVMQEDLHNGLGRHRSKVAIGIHNGEMVKPPIKYFATDDDSYSFVPLGAADKMSIKEILQETEQGRSYGGILSQGLFPLLIDSSGNTLSMPPIINGELTRLKQGIRSMFVDVTAADRTAGETTISVIAAMLADIRAKVESVTIINQDGSSEMTPNMMPETMKFDLNLTNKTLGLKLSYEEARRALEKSRLELLSQGQARVPRFRSDIIHPIDLVEEVELGYGVARLKPLRSKTSLVGSLTLRTKRLQKFVEILIGLELTQIESLSLTSADEVGLDPGQSLKVDDPKSRSYEYMRSEALPSLLGVLGQSTHEEYPQRVFEQVTIFKKKDGLDIPVNEEEHVAVAVADSSSNYTHIRSILDAFLRLILPEQEKVAFEPSTEKDAIFAKGRTAIVTLVNAGEKLGLGKVGEVSPYVLERLGVRVPIAAFELNLEPFLKD
jgi:phenylalanyl-tRNA synthetase beta chain